MAPALVRELFHRDGWVYEEKVDGWRIIAYKDRHRVWLVSRNGVDHSASSATSRRPSRSLSARTLVVDGGVAIYDDLLRSRFEWLREPEPDPSPRPRCSWRTTCCTKSAAT
jgi:bifunctional non-homologous end joining protein LigD